MRWLTAGLVVLLVLLQYPLWFGKGGWLKVWDYDRQLAHQKEVNARLELRNGGLDAEVRDLKQGYEAIEERARFELGMIRPDEVFVQIPERAGAEKAAEKAIDRPADKRGIERAEPRSSAAAAGSSSRKPQ